MFEFEFDDQYFKGGDRDYWANRVQKPDENWMKFDFDHMSKTAHYYRNFLPTHSELDQEIDIKADIDEPFYVFGWVEEFPSTKFVDDRHYIRSICAAEPTTTKVITKAYADYVDKAPERAAREEETRRKAAEEEAARIEAERIAAEKEAARIEAERKAAEEEAKRKAAEEEAKRKAAEEEAKRKAAEEEAKRKAAEEEA